MPDYRYIPYTGELPGASFEKQTQAFFESLQLQIDAINTALGLATQSITHESKTLQQSVADALAVAQAAKALAEEANNTAKAANDLVGQVNTTATNALSAAATAQETADTAVANAATAQARADAAYALAEGIETVPSGAILLYNSATLPDGYVKANGNNSTPDLSGYTTSPLTYMQKS